MAPGSLRGSWEDRGRFYRTVSPDFECPLGRPFSLSNHSGECRGMEDFGINDRLSRPCPPSAQWLTDGREAQHRNLGFVGATSARHGTDVHGQKVVTDDLFPWDRFGSLCAIGTADPSEEPPPSTVTILRSGLPLMAKSGHHASNPAVSAERTPQLWPPCRCSDGSAFAFSRGAHDREVGPGSGLAPSEPRRSTPP